MISTVHTVGLHIGVDLFAVLLLLRLNVVQHLSRLRIGKFEDARVINGRHVLLKGQHIAAKELVALLARFVTVVGASTAAIVGRKRRGDIGHRAARHLIDGLEVASLGLSQGVKEIFQIGTAGTGGVLFVLLDTEKLLIAEVV